MEKINAAVVDSSAFACIVKGEPAASFFLNELRNVHKLYISAVTRAEGILATMSLRGRDAVEE